MQDKICFFFGEQKSTNVQVKVIVEVDEHVERLVLMCDVRTFCVTMVESSKLVAR